MRERVFIGRLNASVSDVVDAIDLLPHYELAAIAVLEGQERPGEEPAIRRRLRAEGIRASEHRGALLLEPGELDRLSSVGMLQGGDELYLGLEWNDEFETFPSRITADATSFREGTPLGLEEWMLDAHCLIALGDGGALNYATTSEDLHDRLQARFPAATR